LVIKGNYLELHKDPELFLATDRALVIFVLEGDSLYLHADTLLSVRDSSGLHRTFKAFHHVKS
jgi:hypothetical protein